jgi:1-acyl-sn-glycerol-3-phosphate acyltransferase
MAAAPGESAFRPRRLLFGASLWAVRLLALPFARIRVEGREHLPEGAFVGIFNHASTLDVAALAWTIRGPVCFWAKAELAERPFIGPWLRGCGAVFVKRGQRDEVAFAEALARLRGGAAFILAPEGTRHHGEDGGRPRTGFVRLAQQSGCPVLPCAVAGAREALPPGRRTPRLFRRGEVRVRVGPALRLDPLPADDAHREGLAAQARALMEVVYRMKRELDSEGGA